MNKENYVRTASNSARAFETNCLIASRSTGNFVL